VTLNYPVVVVVVVVGNILVTVFIGVVPNPTLCDDDYYSPIVGVVGIC
jgi:hypothetical protein